jgi:ubiquitin-conjugating enzyme E2 variant
LITDLLTGIVHWWEDAYGNPDWKYLGKFIVIPNIEHHKNPRSFLKSNFLSRNNVGICTAIIIGSFFYLFIFKESVWQLNFFLIYGSLSNEVHAISHRSKRQNGKLISFLQKIGIIQTQKMHSIHHTSPYDVNYCVLTNYLNPTLNKIGFWQKMENVISFFGINPKRGSENRDGF